MKTFLRMIVIGLSSLTSFAQQWTINADHKIAFSSPDVSGIFKEISGIIQFDPNALTNAKLDLKINVESISTGNGMMNGHAKGEEWFNVAKFPNISFIASKIETTSTGYNAFGKLEIKGIKKDFVIPFTFVKKGTKGTFVAKFNVDRTDFGVGKKGEDVAQTLKIVATIPVTKK